MYQEKGLARKVVAAAVAVLVMLATLVPCRPALAAGGSLTVESSQEGIELDAYQVATADSGEGRSLVGVGWPDATWGARVVTTLEGVGYVADPDDRDNAQSALEWAASTLDAGQGAREVTLALGTLCAREGTPSAHFKAGEAVTLGAGWWCVLTSPATAGGRPAAATSPVLVPITNEAVTVSEKVALPTLSKEVQEDRDGSWGKAADARTEQAVGYRLSTKVPEGIEGYVEYPVSFIDRLDAETSYVEGSVSVTLDGRDVTGSCTTTSRGDELRVDVGDLIALGAKAGDELVVRYDAALVVGAACGWDGRHDNVARLSFANDPCDPTSRGLTLPDDATLVTYRLEVTIRERETHVPIVGAEVTLRDVETGQFVQKDGTLGSKPHYFVTDDDGLFGVSGLDEGSYVGTVTSLPGDYRLEDREFDLVVGSELDKRTLSAETTSPATITGVDARPGLIEELIEVERPDRPSDNGGGKKQDSPTKQASSETKAKQASASTPAKATAIERLAQTGQGLMLLGATLGGLMAARVGLRGLMGSREDDGEKTE